MNRILIAFITIFIMSSVGWAGKRSNRFDLDRGSIRQNNTPNIPVADGVNHHIWHGVRYFTGECIPAGQDSRDKVVVFDSTGAIGEYRNFNDFHQGLIMEIEQNRDSQSRCPYLIQFRDGRPDHQNQIVTQVVCKDFDVPDLHILMTCEREDAHGVRTRAYLYREDAANPYFYSSINYRGQYSSFADTSRNASVLQVYRVAEDYDLSRN